VDEPIKPRPSLQRANLHRILEALQRAKPTEGDSFAVVGLGFREVDAMVRLVKEAIEDGR
jgi:hypothetical protein